MYEWNEIFDKGVKYKKIAIGMGLNKRFSNSVIVGVLILSTECFLGTLTQMKGLFVEHGGIAPLIKQLREQTQIPEPIDKLVKKLSLLALVCNGNPINTNISNEQIGHLISSLEELEIWVQFEMNAFLLSQVPSDQIKIETTV